MFTDGNATFREQIDTKTGKVTGCIDNSNEYMNCIDCAYNDCSMRGKVFDVWNKNGGGDLMLIDKSCPHFTYKKKATSKNRFAFCVLNQKYVQNCGTCNRNISKQVSELY